MFGFCYLVIEIYFQRAGNEPYEFVAGNKPNEFVVMPNHPRGIIEFVGVPLVGTQNAWQQQTMFEPQTTGQPQGIAPTVHRPLNFL